MSSFNSLAKKLLPAKKAWKSFKITFQSKLQKLKTAYKGNKRTRKLCINTLNKIRVLIPRNSNPPRRNPHHFHHYHQHVRSSSAIFVDQLFSSAHVQPAKAKEEMAGASSSRGTDTTANGGNSTFVNVENQQQKHHQIGVPGVVKIHLEKKGDAWKSPLLLPQLRCVDERAEEFIAKFRHEMKLQREQSIVDFQEMLARSI